MNKKEFIAALAQKTETTQVASERFLENFMDLVMETVANGDSVRLTGFGVWEHSERSEREGRNPQTGETMLIAGKRVPKFKPGKSFKDMVAGK